MDDQQQITAADVQELNQRSRDLIDQLVNQDGLDGSYAAGLCARVAGTLIALTAENSDMSPEQRHALTDQVVTMLRNTAHWQVEVAH